MWFAQNKLSRIKSFIPRLFRVHLVFWRPYIHLAPSCATPKDRHWVYYISLFCGTNTVISICFYFIKTISKKLNKIVSFLYYVYISTKKVFDWISFRLVWNHLCSKKKEKKNRRGSEIGLLRPSGFRTNSLSYHTGWVCRTEGWLFFFASLSRPFT